MEKKRSVVFYVVVPILVAVIGGIFVLFSGILSRPDPQEEKTGGQIISPESGQEVTSNIKVQGKLSGVPEGKHVWIAVKVGDLLWPKEPEINPGDRVWDVTIFEPSAGRSFALVLLLVDENGNKQIYNWLERGRRFGDYPGFSRVPGSTQLDIVSDLIIK